MKIKVFRKNAPWFLGFGMLGLTIASQTFAGVYMFYYVDKLGISLLMFTIAKTVYMIWDAINDPLSGIISDRTRSKIGRRKFWLIVSAPLFMLGFILIFSPPASLIESGNKIGLAWWLFLGLMVYETAAGLQWVNYLNSLKNITYANNQHKVHHKTLNLMLISTIKQKRLKYIRKTLDKSSVVCYTL